MSAQLVQLVYVSSATVPADNETFLSIQDTALKRNPADDITGVLLYGSGRFLQLLEGPEHAVDALLTDIQRDGRHRFVKTLVRRKIESRSAPNWGMGVLNLRASGAGRYLDTLLESHATAFAEVTCDEEATQAIRNLVYAFERHANWDPSDGPLELMDGDAA